MRLVKMAQRLKTLKNKCSLDYIGVCLLKLLVGLGNPGSNYSFNRHNFGFLLVDALAQNERVSFKETRHKASVAECSIANQKVLLVKPQTFMNLSGEAVSSLTNFYKIAPDDVVVAYDDLDLPLGKMRWGKSSSSGGHNGIKSLLSHLGGGEFNRLRLGIGRPPVGREVIQYVLQDFSKSEQQLVQKVVQASQEAIQVFFSQGLTTVMNRFNGLDLGVKEGEGFLSK